MIYRVTFIMAMVLTTFLIVLFGQSSAMAKDKTKHKIYAMEPHNIGTYIKSTRGKRRVILIYASWCPYCVKVFPKIMNLERANKGTIISISVDENEKAFVRYIKKFDDVPFPIILNDGSERALARYLGVFGVKPWKGIPAFILMDENNKVVEQGNYNIEYLADFISGD